MLRHWITFIALLFLITGCSSDYMFGKSSRTVAKQEARIDKTDTKLASLDKRKLEDIAVWAYGTDYALNQVTNAPQPVITARITNQRVISEAGYSPSIEQIKAMQTLIDNLILTNEAGILELAKRDMEIEFLRDNERLLKETKDEQVRKLSILATEAAGQADTTASELSKYQQYWGLGGIWLGIVSLARHLMWVGVGFTIVYIVLRIFAASNPFCAIAFGVLQSIAATLIHIIEALVPRSMETIEIAKDDVVKFAEAIKAAALDNKTNK